MARTDSRGLARSHQSLIRDRFDAAFQMVESQGRDTVSFGVRAADGRRIVVFIAIDPAASVVEGLLEKHAGIFEAIGGSEATSA